MVQQIIQKYVDIFESFVISHFIEEQDYYVYNNEVFKKLVFDDTLDNFICALKPYYFKNKHFYLQRHPYTYNSFNTILRQIMKRNNIQVEKKVKYQKSKYQVEFHIFMNNIEK